MPEVYFSGPSVSKQGAVLGSRRLRGVMRTRMEDLIQIGIPTSRLGMMLQFSSTRGAGGREGLQPLGKWLDVVKWEALAAKQVAGELHVPTIWSWGWASFNPSGNDPDKPIVACTYLWTRDHSLCDAPALAGAQLDQSLDVGATLPAGTVCLLGKTALKATDLAAMARVTGRPRRRLLGGVRARGARRRRSGSTRPRSPRPSAGSSSTGSTVPRARTSPRWPRRR